MSDVKVPDLPESVVDATIDSWSCQEGDVVQAGDHLVDLETDKIMLEVPAPHAGKVTKINRPKGDTVKTGELLLSLEAVSAEEKKVEQHEPTPAPQQPVESQPEDSTADAIKAGPAARKKMFEQQVAPSQVQGSGKGGRIMPADVTGQTASDKVVSADREKRVPMSRLRKRVAERLLEVQSQCAILTTFNEVNMQPVMALRNRHKAAFEKRHGVRLGFMSFFIRAMVAAIKAFPIMNATLDGQDVVYFNYVDMGVAISSPRGLLVPIIRGAHQLSMAEIEQAIVDFSQKAQSGQLTMDDLTGGTMTVSNAGKFGSMLSTPIINPPQSAILGMHNIVERPTVIDQQVVVRPIMYLALSYDHRLIDGADAVQFLMHIKNTLEDPSRLLLDI
ncbi:2-oxoglutarate dehydrogenase complex dihydrolipoyllysine-residue succinyltransferase [Gammaproteobacteria bacterium]|nr:2-oxoglutarate dehydrogenase complex dihydrolipoyllysine-residue succinyltransferase [Gammaproteobacteria bacterium]